jgi:hypothetical protein
MPAPQSLPGLGDERTNEQGFAFGAEARMVAVLPPAAARPSSAFHFAAG